MGLKLDAGQVGLAPVDTVGVEIRAEELDGRGIKTAQGFKKKTGATAPLADMVQGMKGTVFFKQSLESRSLILSGFGITGVSGVMAGSVDERQGREGAIGVCLVEGAIFELGTCGANQEGDSIAGGEEAQLTQKPQDLMAVDKHDCREILAYGRDRSTYFRSILRSIRFFSCGQRGEKPMIIPVPRVASGTTQGGG